MRRRFKKARVKFISLVPRGANQLPTVLKEEGDGAAFDLQLLTKEMSEQGELIACVYAPEFRDKQGDIASAEVIKDMAYSAARDGLEIDVRHDGKAVGKERAYVAEQFIIQKGDPRFEGMKDYSGNDVDVTGGWGVVLKIEDEGLKKLYREGKWNGVSMGGHGQFEVEKADSKDDEIDGFLRRVAKALGFGSSASKQEDEEDKMKPEEIAKIAAEAAKAVVTEMQKAQGAAAPADDAPKTEPAPGASSGPVFKGDPTNPEDVKAHREAIRKHDLEQRLAKAKTAAEVDAILKELEGQGTAEDPNEALIKKHEAEIAKLRKRSNQPAAPSTGTTTKESAADGLLVGEGISKEDQDLVEAGRKMAAYVNAQRGYATAK